LLLLTSCQQTCMTYTIPPLPGYRPAPSWVHYTTSYNKRYNAPEDGRDHHPKHVELIGIINKPLLLNLVGVCIIHVSDARSNKYQCWQRYLFVKCVLHVSACTVTIRYHFIMCT